MHWDAERRSKAALPANPGRRSRRVFGISEAQEKELGPVVTSPTTGTPQAVRLEKRQLKARKPTASYRLVSRRGHDSRRGALASRHGHISDVVTRRHLQKATSPILQRAAVARAALQPSGPLGRRGAVRKGVQQQKNQTPLQTQRPHATERAWMVAAAAAQLRPPMVRGVVVCSRSDGCISTSSTGGSGVFAVRRDSNLHGRSQAR